MRLNPVFDRCFRVLYGKPCWNTKAGYGSFITFEVGEPHLVVHEPRKSPAKSKKVRNLFARRLVTIRGDWHFWIYCCKWSVFSSGKLVGDSSSVQAIRKAIACLDGQPLCPQLPRPGRVGFGRSISPPLVDALPLGDCNARTTDFRPPNLVKRSC